MMRPSIAMRTYARDYKGLISLGKSVVKNLTANPLYINPLPPASVLDAAIHETEMALAKWGVVGNRGSKVDLLDLRAKSRALFQLLDTEARYVEQVAKITCAQDVMLMASMMASSGFALRRDNAPQGVLEKVENFHRVVSSALNPNQALLRWRKPLNLRSAKNVKSYTVYRSSTPDFREAEAIGFPLKTFFIDTDMTGVTQIWHYWVVPFNSAGAGMRSEMIKVMLTAL
jgi:hypothetical protein